MVKLDFSKRYEVKGFPRIACFLVGYPKVWEPVYYVHTDEDGVEHEEDSGEGEWIDDTECGRVLAIMVGDDYKHSVDIDDLVPLDDLDYCAECGQVGCTHDGRDRS